MFPIIPIAVVGYAAYKFFTVDTTVKPEKIPEHLIPDPEPEPEPVPEPPVYPDTLNEYVRKNYDFFVDDEAKFVERLANSIESQALKILSCSTPCTVTDSEIAYLTVYKFKEVVDDLSECRGKHLWSCLSRDRLIRRNNHGEFVGGGYRLNSLEDLYVCRAARAIIDDPKIGPMVLQRYSGSTGTFKLNDDTVIILAKILRSVVPVSNRQFEEALLDVLADLW